MNTIDFSSKIGMTAADLAAMLAEVEKASGPNHVARVILRCLFDFDAGWAEANKAADKALATAIETTVPAERWIALCAAAAVSEDTTPGALLDKLDKLRAQEHEQDKPTHHRDGVLPLPIHDVLVEGDLPDGSRGALPAWLRDKVLTYGRRCFEAGARTYREVAADRAAQERDTRPLKEEK